MEYDTPRGGRVKTKHLAQMPCYSLTLAVLIRRQPYHVGSLDSLAKVINQLLLIVGYLIDRRKTIVDVYAELLLVEVTDMAV